MKTQTQHYANFLPFSVLIAIFVIYLLMSTSAINESQMIYGDMHTLYLSKQLEEGKILYKDLQLLYGPVFYLIGAGLLSLGASYAGMKMFMMLIAVASGILVFLISKNAFNVDNKIAILSVAIYMFLPIHYGVAPIFHADSFAVLFILASLYFLLKNKNKSLVLAAVFASLAFFSKMPVIPITLAPVIYFLINKRKEGLFYVIPFIFIVAITLAYLSTLTHSDNVSVIFNYLVKDPNPPYSILRDFGWIEGFAFLVSCIGFFLYVKKSKSKFVISYMAIASVISFGAILVRGVGIYEANYMEPFIALFGSFMIFYLKEKWKADRTRTKVAIVLIIIVLFGQFLVFVLPGRERVADWHGNGRAKEMNEIADIHSKLLEKYTAKEDIVVASPMAVFRTDRTIPFDDQYPELLKIKYNLGYETAKQQVAHLDDMLKKKEIKMLITFNSSKFDSPKFAALQDGLFFPFYLEQLNEDMSKNYDRIEENGLYYYLPKP